MRVINELKYMLDNKFIFLFTILFIIIYISKPLLSGELIMTESPIIKIIIIIMILLLIFYYYRGYSLRFLIILMFILLFAYFYTYQIEYSYPKYGYPISSSVYIKNSNNFEFISFRQYIFYSDNTATLEQILTIRNVKPVNTYMSFGLPKNTSYYEIWINSVSSNIFYINGTNRSDVSYKNINFPASIHEIIMKYRIKNVEPIGIIHFFVLGENSRPNINKISAFVMFSKLKYKCPATCIVIPYNKGYYTIVDRPISYGRATQNNKNNILFPAYFLDIYAENSSELRYVLYTRYKNPIILRNVLLAAIIGIVIQITNILVSKRDEYIKEIKNIIKLK